MGLGAIYGRIKGKYRHGLRVAYYRDLVRPRILRTPPVRDTTDSRCEIHVMTSKDDWLNLVWALKSFYRVSDRRYALCIHEDGTVSAEGLMVLKDHFPDARLIERQQADAQVLPALQAFPRCLDFRKSNHLSPKVFDFVHYLEGGRMLLLDSDVLFFARPQALLERIENPAYVLNTVNGDLASAYTVEPATVKEALGFNMIERFNSGLGLIHRGSMRLDWIEQFLALPGVIGHFWRIEQTIFALCSSKWGCELLPAEYDVRLGPTTEPLPSRHYIGAVRHLMYSEGMRKLVREGFLA